MYRSRRRSAITISTRKIASYLATEATIDDGGDEDEQEEDLELQDFISVAEDQNPDSLSSPVPFQLSFSNQQFSMQEEIKKCERIAQQSVNRARKERAVLLVHEEMLDKHNLRSLVPSTSDLTTSPLYAFRVPSTEEQLLQYFTLSQQERIPLASML
ncbi:hypothetical protein K438DRAFT_1770971 [Mycena galopus ATCC 62051]|nr:hypothetical protein K438DRAFT_1770971 [Mycena galopus ATCC 62051]